MTTPSRASFVVLFGLQRSAPLVLMCSRVGAMRQGVTAQAVESVTTLLVYASAFQVRGRSLNHIASLHPHEITHHKCI